MKANDLQIIVDGVAPVMRELVEAGTAPIVERVSALEQKALVTPKDGRDGADGARGEKGDPGDRGLTGETGPQGERGERGEPGAAADTGALISAIRTEIREAAAVEQSAFIGQLTAAVLSKAMAAGFTTDATS